MEEIRDQVIEIIAEQSGVAQENITEESKIVDDLGCDSLDSVEIAMELEDKFGIEISDEDAEKMLTVGDVIKYIEEKKG